MKKAFNKNILICIWSSIVIALFPVAFLYFANITELALGDILSAVSFSLAAIAVLVIAALLFTRDILKACVVAGIFYLLCVNYSLIEQMTQGLLPAAKYWHIIPCVIFIYLHIAYFLCKKLPKSFFEMGTMVLGLVFSVLIVINIATAVPAMIEKWNSRTRTSQESEMSVQADSAAQSIAAYPNIYYLLFDEYSNFPLLEKYYQYDNGELRSFLESNGFMISLNSQNESTSTHVVTTNNLNLSYVATSLLDYEQYRDSPPLFEILDSYGYEIQYLSNLPIGWEEAAIERREAKTIDGLDFWDIFIQRTAFGHFFSQDNGNEYQKAFYEQFDFLNESIKLQDSNSFVYVHFDFPHLPFVFDENGGYVGMENRNNTEDGKYYLGQLKYTTEYMLDSLKKILEEDPNSIIILQSDHSNRHHGKPLGQGSLISWDEASNIFNAVYYMGEDISEIDGLSSVNTLRIILNKVLGTELEILEVPCYE